MSIEKSVPELDPFFLGDMVSFEHGDCSVAASNANQTVYEILRQREYRSGKNRWTMHRIVSLFDAATSNNTERTLADSLCLGQTLTVNGEEAVLEVLQPYLETYEMVEVAPAPLPTPSSPKRGLLGRKAVESVAAPPEPRYIRKPVKKELPPKLVAMFGQDLYVPLAGFEYRDQLGACSFMQLGEEMYDDNYFVTPKDEEGPRHDLVKAIRGILKGGTYAPEEAEYKLLEKFAREEAARYSEQWLAKKEAQFIRRSKEKIDESQTEKSLLMLDESEGMAIEQLYEYKAVGAEAYLPSGRRVQLALVRQKDMPGEETIFLCGVTRGNVALPLMQMKPQAAILSLLAVEAGLTADQRQDLMDRIDGIVAGDLNTVYFEDVPDNFKGFYLDDELDATISEHLYDMGLLNEKEWRKSDSKTYWYETRGVFDRVERRELRKKGKAVFDEIEAYLADTFTGRPTAYASSPPLQLALYRLKRLHERMAAEIQDFAIDRRLDEATGETGPLQEQLYEKIIALAANGGSYRKVLPDVPLRTTEGDISLGAVATLKGQEGELQLRGRPVGTAQSAEAPYVRVPFDTTQPLFAVHEAGKSNPEAYAFNLLHLLNQIVPYIQPPKEGKSSQGIALGQGSSATTYSAGFGE